MTEGGRVINGKASPMSVADDVGYIIERDSKIFRVISHEKRHQVVKLMESGLIQELSEKILIPETKISDSVGPDNSLMIEHERIVPLVYPFEWSPEMLKDAAMTVLKVNKICNEYGYELKDAHPFNVVFRFKNPVFVDIGSIIPKKHESSSWLAYDEFLNSYFYPLRLYRAGFRRLYKALFLPGGTAFGNETMILSMYWLRILGYRPARFFLQFLSVVRRRHSISLANRKFRGLVFVKSLLFVLKKIPTNGPRQQKKLGKKIERLSFSVKTQWENYHKNSGFLKSDGTIHLNSRLNWVLKTIESLNPSTVIDLAGNQGVLARTLGRNETISSVLCVDYDENAVDQLFRSLKKDGRVIPANFDIMDEAWQKIGHNERRSRLCSDMAVALAVTHHLTLAQGYSFESIMQMLAGYTKKHVVVEFMPKGLWNGTSAPKTPNWYTEQNFREAFLRHFSLLERSELEQNRICYVGKRLPDSGCKA